MLQHLLALGKPMETNMPSTSTYKHKHHIIPRHAGGTDDPSNLIKVNVAMHAFLHKQLWEDNGFIEDKLAWLGLSGQKSFREIDKIYSDIYYSYFDKQKGGLNISDEQFKTEVLSL